MSDMIIKNVRDSGKMFPVYMLKEGKIVDPNAVLDENVAYGVNAMLTGISIAQELEFTEPVFPEEEIHDLSYIFSSKTAMTHAMQKQMNACYDDQVKVYNQKKIKGEKGLEIPTILRTPTMQDVINQLPESDFRNKIRALK